MLAGHMLSNRSKHAADGQPLTGFVAAGIGTGGSSLTIFKRISDLFERQPDTASFWTQSSSPDRQSGRYSWTILSPAF
jgi:hypothetical protein